MLGTTRVCRARGERAPDVVPVVLPSGITLTVEVKTRSRGLAVITNALHQAAGYLPGAVPLAVVSATGCEAIACLPLRAFAAIAGLRIETSNDPLQLPLLGVGVPGGVRSGAGGT